MENVYVVLPGPVGNCKRLNKAFAPLNKNTVYSNEKNEKSSSVIEAVLSEQ